MKKMHKKTGRSGFSLTIVIIIACLAGSPHGEAVSWQALVSGFHGDTFAVQGFCGCLRLPLAQANAAFARSVKNCSLFSRLFSQFFTVAPTTHKNLFASILCNSFNPRSSLMHKDTLRPMAAAGHVELMPSLSLEELTDMIIKRCKSGDYSSLRLNWNDYIYEYQEFIKHAAAINAAIKELLYCDSVTSDFYTVAIQVKIDMIEHYQAPLSAVGISAIESIKQCTTNSKLKNNLITLIDPPHSWFAPFFNKTRKGVLDREYSTRPVNAFTFPKIVGTWGCSTQCDHCDGGSLIRVTSFPWSWLSQIHSAKTETFTFSKDKNDIVRDYYDFVFDKDAGDFITELCPNTVSITISGFEKGSVGERALKKIMPLLKKANPTGFQLVVSIAPSGWMRRIKDKYIEHILHIEELAGNNGMSIRFDFYPFKRIGDSIDLVMASLKSRLRSAMSSPPMQACGRFKQLLGQFDVLPGNSEQAWMQREDKGTFFYLPDGSLVRGIGQDEDDLYRAYEVVEDFGHIGRSAIRCWSCSVYCRGNNGCLGRTEFFKRWGLSPTGGPQIKLAMDAAA